jgi:anaerobic magnesium-protoporphyrin IX monomethyl ester cyclase
MNIYLATMPAGDATQPYTALPMLTSQLRSAGFEVTQTDLGLEYIYYCIEPHRFRSFISKLRREIVRMEAQQDLCEAWDDYVDLKLLETELHPFKDNLMGELLRLKQPDVLRNLRDLGRLLQLLAALQNLLTFIERKELPGYRPFNLLTVEEANSSLNKKASLYRRFTRDVILKDLTKNLPNLVGFSVTYPKQLYPTLQACAEIKHRWPKIKIVLGGAYLTTIHETFERLPEWLRLWDFVVVGEGETALIRLAEALQCDQNFKTVPNLLYHINGLVQRSEVQHTEDVHRLLPPDYRGLPIDRYLTPEPVFLLPVARGCYMRCTFCSISYATSGYRCRTGAEIVADIQDVREQFPDRNIRLFNFSIDVMSPTHLQQMASAIEKADIGISWDAEIRLDRTLGRDVIRSMKAAGCCHLRFGLESAVDRIRVLMDKRIEIERVKEILADCRREDIKTSTMVIIGFPGESAAEAAETARFLSDNRDKIRYFALNVFTVSRGSIIAANPKRFAIELTSRNELAVQPSWTFQITEGLTTNEARDLVARMRDDLTADFPLAEDGFSVGIGGAFTFLVALTWTWEELEKLDFTLSNHRDQADNTKVFRVTHRCRFFTSPFDKAQNTFPRKRTRIWYASTGRTHLFQIGSAAASVLSDMARRGCRLPEIQSSIGESHEKTCEFLRHLMDQGIVYPTLTVDTNEQIS